MTAVIIAIRGGMSAKTRLAGLLDREMRQALVAAMLSTMLRRIGSARCTVISPTTALLDLSERQGALVLAQTSGGLNEAFEAARTDLSVGAVFLPGDLPLVRAAEVDALLGALDEAHVVLSPAFRDAGTAAVAVGPGVVFRPVFGPDSFRGHSVKAGRAGLSVATVRRPGLGEDIDRPDDLARLFRIARADPELHELAALLAAAGLFSRSLEAAV